MCPVWEDKDVVDNNVIDILMFKPSLTVLYSQLQEPWW